VIPKDLSLMSEVYPKCKKCGSFRVARFEELTTERPEKTDDGKPLPWLGSALPLKRFLRLDVAGERLLP
jgi:hypothetical protein